MRLTCVSAWGLQYQGQNTPEMNLAREMVARGFEVDCLTYAVSQPKAMNGRGTLGSLTIRSLQPYVGRIGNLTLLQLQPRRLMRIMQAFMRPKPDIWHMHHPSSLSIAASLALLARKEAPVVFTSHDPLVASRIRLVLTRRSIRGVINHRPAQRIPEVIARSIPFAVSDRIIALTNFEKRVLVSQGIEGRRIAVIPHGVRQVTTRTAGLREKLGLKDKLIVLTVARFVNQKGHRYLIEAIPSIVRHFDAHFVMVGRESATLPRLKELSRLLKVDENITFLTSVDEGVLGAAYAESDVFVLPSLYESFGIVLLEAMIARKPVVATGVGGIREIVDNERTGIIVPPADPESLGRAIQTLLGNAEMRARLGKEGQRSVSEKYSWPTIAERTEEVYEDALKNKANSPDHAL